MITPHSAEKTRNPPRNNQVVVSSAMRIVTRMTISATAASTGASCVAVRFARTRAVKASQGRPAPASTPIATPTSSPIAWESVPMYARVGSPVGEKRTAIHTVDATAPIRAISDARTGWRTSARRVAKNTSGRTM